MSTESDPAKNQFAAAASEKMEDSRALPPERSLWKGGYSAKVMYGTWILCAAATIGGIIAAAMLASGDSANIVWMTVGAIILVMWCLAIATFIYRRLGMHYELTTQRFVHQEGVFVRRTDRIEVIDIDDVSYSQGIIQRMLGVGRIVITSSDRSHPELVMHGVDKVPEIASLVDDVRREERRRRSLHIESI